MFLANSSPIWLFASNTPAVLGSLIVTVIVLYIYFQFFFSSQTQRAVSFREFVKSIPKLLVIVLIALILLFLGTGGFAWLILIVLGMYALIVLGVLTAVLLIFTLIAHLLKVIMRMSVVNSPEPTKIVVLVKATIVVCGVLLMTFGAAHLLVHSLPHLSLEDARVDFSKSYKSSILSSPYANYTETEIEKSVEGQWYDQLFHCRKKNILLFFPACIYEKSDGEVFLIDTEA